MMKEISKELIHCPFCGNMHHPKVTDLTAHYAGYLEINVKPENIDSLPDLVYREMKRRKLPVTHSELEDGWTE